ncbi:MAG: hypothetical protein HC835_04205 [Oscillatoriales cyanobacterium RM2_1_1]|nr:hypothetical protein [Oscillatoriales cyanobacterium RM2_1_1]
MLGLQATLQTNLETSYLQALQRELTIWFTQAMERASGVYKRRVRSHTLLIGLILAIVLNADTLNMANRLAEEPLLQERLLQTFEQSSLIYPPENLTPSGNQLDVFALLAEVSMLPVGWSAENLIGQFGQALEPRTDVLKVLRVLLGWSLTAIATSMGSSFWFDLLNQVVNVRNTGKKPPGIQGDKSV